MGLKSAKANQYAHLDDGCTAKSSPAGTIPPSARRKDNVAGGILKSNKEFTDHFEFYDPTKDAWTSLKPLPEVRHHITLSNVKGRIYGIGGFTGGFPDWRALPTMFIYEPASNTWVKGVDLPVARAEGVAAAVDDKIYLIGGRVRANENARHFNDHTDSTRNEVFDPSIRKWSKRGRCSNGPQQRGGSCY